MSKTTKFTIGALLIAALALAFGAGYTMSGRIHRGPSEGLHSIEQAWGIIFSDFVDKEKLDTGILSQAAIEGMLKALDDPYTSYLNAMHYQLGLSSLEGKFDGIGAQVTIRDDQLTVIAPIAGSPAEKAGVRAGDTILEIDGQTTSEMSLAEAVLNIRGAKGTPVRLLILHEGETQPVEIEIIRDNIELTSVRFEMMGDIAYINITQFSERTDKELTPILHDATDQGATGIVLDLRSNPGGLLDTVVDDASHFLPEGVIVKVASNDENISLSVRPDMFTTDLPMVVLTDNFSASGSEVLAGALQDYGRATIAGTRTFGKGSVDVLRQLDDGSAIYITTARWLTPKGRLIEGKGIDPDYELDLTGDEAVQWAIDFLKNKGNP